MEKMLNVEEMVSSINIGNIFVYTWGYDQTNADFFKVIRKTTKSIVIKKLKGQESSDGGFMTGIATPTEEFDETEKEMRKTPFIFWERMHLRMKYGSCEKWDGEPVRVSHYA